MGMKEAMGKVWDELKKPVNQGQAEMANLLFQGQAFVPYGEAQQEAKIDKPEHGLPPEASKEQEQQKDVERGGMEIG